MNSFRYMHIFLSRVFVVISCLETESLVSEFFIEIPFYKSFANIFSRIELFKIPGKSTMESKLRLIYSLPENFFKLVTPVLKAA